LIFAWDQNNRDHIAEHGVKPVEAEFVVQNAAIPYPENLGDQKWLVWGPTAGGRLLQVVFVLKAQDEVEFGAVALLDWLALESTTSTKITRVIHAMELTPDMKRLLRRRRR
jgi:uncharacterized DUF497 family protein